METNKNFFKKLIYLLAVMAVIAIVGAGLCGVSYKKQPTGTIDSDKLQVVTSFHPMYVLMKNLFKDMTDVNVSNMTTGLSGCIHDYQVTTEDMRKLSKADFFVVNGMGMESFLTGIAKKNPKLNIIAASGDLDMDEKDEGHNHEENGHLWMNPHTYFDEFSNLYNAFVEYFNKNGMEESFNGLYLNYESYGSSILSLIKKYDETAKSLPEDIYVICYNEAFELFAEGLGLKVIAVFSLDEDEMPSAGEIADAINEAKTHDKVLVLIEKNLAYHADKVVSETEARTVYIDPLTGGDDSYDSYINGMTENINAVSQSIK